MRSIFPRIWLRVSLGTSSRISPQVSAVLFCAVLACVALLAVSCADATRESGAPIILPTTSDATSDPVQATASPDVESDAQPDSESGTELDTQTAQPEVAQPAPSEAGEQPSESPSSVPNIPTPLTLPPALRFAPEIEPVEDFYFPPSWCQNTIDVYSVFDQSLNPGWCDSVSEYSRSILGCIRAIDVAQATIDEVGDQIPLDSTQELVEFLDFVYSGPSEETITPDTDAAVRECYFAFLTPDVLDPIFLTSATERIRLHFRLSVSTLATCLAFAQLPEGAEGIPARASACNEQDSHQAGCAVMSSFWEALVARGNFRNPPTPQTVQTICLTTEGLYYEGSITRRVEETFPTVLAV